MNVKILMYAMIAPSSTCEIRQKVGLPPQLTDGIDTRSTLPWPRVITISDHGDGEFFLFRWTIDGEFCGDTGHRTLGDAQHQADFEYGELLDGWHVLAANNELTIEQILEFVQREGGVEERIDDEKT